jgi:mRNA interferase MazF
VLCPITTQVKGHPFEVLIPPGLKVSGAVLADQVKNLDWRARRAEFLCRLPRRTIVEVLEKLGTLIFPADA